jgi:hypothetical protein
VTTKSPLQNILQGILHTKKESTRRRQAVSNHRRTKEKGLRINIDSAAQNQTLEQQKKLNDRNHHIPLNIKNECLGLNSPIKRHHLANCIKKEDPIIYCLQDTHLIDRNKHWIMVKGWKKIYQTNDPPKQAGGAVLTSDKVDFLQSNICQTR